MEPDSSTVAAAARQLLQAWNGGSTIDLLSQTWPGLGLAAAEAIAVETTRLRGQPVVGFKLGYTSAAMRQQMNIASPNFGRLTHDMDMSRGAVGNTFVHPRIEPEIALILGKSLDSPDATLDQVRDAVESAHPSFEIVDTRYHDYKFTLVDNTADNSSAAGFVLGPPHRPSDLLERGIAVSLSVAGAATAQGSSRDAMGGPLQSLLWLVHELATRGLSVPEGSVILTGGLTQAPWLVKGQTISADFAELGTITCRL